MKKKIRIGVMGCASVAERSVIPAILALPDHFQLMAVASRSAGKAIDFASRFGCEPVTSYEKLLARDDVDALYIPLPTGLHAQWVNRGLESGKHVYTEKSMAMHYREACDMVTKAEHHGLALMEGYMFQYHPQHEAIRQMLREGIIGEIRHFSGAFGFPPLPADNFRNDEAIGGGALMDAAGYPLRAAFMLLGSQIRVTGASLYRDPSSGTSLFGSAYLTGENGMGASIAFGFDNFYRCTYSVWGSRGRLTALKAFTPKRDETPQVLLEIPGKQEMIACSPADHFVLAMQEFHRIITGNGREKHYREIMEQSQALDTIRNLTS